MNHTGASGWTPLYSQEEKCYKIGSNYLRNSRMPLAMTTSTDNW